MPPPTPSNPASTPANPPMTSNSTSIWINNIVSGMPLPFILRRSKPYTGQDKRKRRQRPMPTRQDRLRARPPDRRHSIAWLEPQQSPRNAQFQHRAEQIPQQTGPLAVNRSFRTKIQTQRIVEQSRQYIFIEGIAALPPF